MEKDLRSKDSGTGMSVELSHEDYYFPSVDLLTAQVHVDKGLTLKSGDRRRIIRSLLSLFLFRIFSPLSYWT